MDFFDVLVRYEVALWNEVDRQLARRGLVRLGSVHALRVLDRYDGTARVQDVSSDIGMTVGAASKLVDRLERDGLVVRRANPDDRRSSLVALTPIGRAAMEEAVEVCTGVLRDATGPVDVAQLSKQLGVLVGRLDDVRSGATV